MSTQYLLLIFLSSLLIPAYCWSQQSFLEILSQYETWDNHAIAPTPDNGFIIGNDLKFPPGDWERHAFYLSKYDSCGIVEWAKAYGSDHQALYFSDLVELSNGDAMAMGQTGFDDLFLMRIDAAGNVLRMFTFDTSNGDQTYNLDIQNGKLMIFGNYYTESGSRNFLLVTDENGQIDWAKSYHARVGPGAATYCEDGSFVCVNGNEIYKVSDTGNLVWSQNITTLNAEEANLSRPVESESGYVVAVRSPEQNSQYLLKFNTSGQVMWRSDQIPAGFLASSVDRLSNGNLIMVNAQPRIGEGVDGGAPFLAEFSPAGKIVGQYGFELDAFGRFTPPICRTGNNGSVTIKGSYYEDGNYDYVIRLKPGDDLSCAGYAYDSVVTDSVVLDLRPSNATATNLNFTSADTLIVETLNLSFNPENLCSPIPDSSAMDFFDRLQCIDTLHFTSPLQNATYLWSDGSREADRVLKAPGLYHVTATTCRTEIDISIELEMGLCPCTYYVPNAFSPNGDGVNDLFETYATCAFQTFELQIFNRWGELLHQSRSPEAGWDGTSGGRPVAQGVYTYFLKYSWELQPGLVREKSDRGTLAIIR